MESEKFKMKKAENRHKEKLIIAPASRDIKDVLERKIEELSRHLAEEKQVSRREKIHVARLHRELARYKGDKEVKEKDTLVKDLSQERMLRADAEKKLRELMIESDQSQTRFHQLQTEFQKMEQAVTQMMQFKCKIDQLKQEKSSLSMQYENNLQKYNNHISSLERENIMLLNDVKKFEQQMSNGTDQERTKLLLERLKVLEAENSSLVLENEQQRQQYEKCLDEIANQVVQALLAQKALREECVKLQTRVQDLECQNKELNHLFQQKVKYSSDTVLQTLPSSATVSTSTLCEGTSCYNSVCSLPASSAVSIDTMHLSPLSQTILQSAVTQTLTVHTTSTDSLHSIDSSSIANETKTQSGNNSDKTMCGSPECGATCDNVNCRTEIETEFPANNSSPKMKHVSIVERANEKTKQRSSSTSSLIGVSRPRTIRTNSTASLGKSKIVPPSVSLSSSNVSANQVEVAVQIHQSESTATAKKRSQSQPDHINKTIPGNQSKTGSKSSKAELSKSTSKLSSKLQKSSSSSSIPTKKMSKSQSTLPQPASSRLPQKRQDQDSGKRNSGSLPHVNSRVPKTVPSSKMSTQGSTVTKPHQITTQLSLDSRKKETLPANHQPARVPSLPNGQYFYDYSDEDSDVNRPISGLSNGSTISINEILDDDEDTDTLLDADFTAEKFAFFETPQFIKQDKKKKEKSKSSKEKPLFSSLRGKPDIVKDTEYSEQKNKIRSPRSHRRRSSMPHSLKSKPHRPSSLVLPSKGKSELQNAYSSSSLESSDSDERWSPQFTRRYKLKQYQGHRSGSSESGSMSGSLSEKVQMKSSQELTPTVSEKSFVNPAEVKEQDIYREVIVVKNMEETQATKKGPPPPIAKKPLPGRRSPGIIMGIQSPGLRSKGLSLFNGGPDAALLKPHEFKTGVFENLETSTCVQIATDSPITQAHKYMSSDSSFESMKNEKVERSGSKDDGYSTMSSDIQPEMLEKFSDSSLKRDTILRSDFQNRNEFTVMHVSESSQKSISMGAPVIDTKVVSPPPNLSPKQISPKILDRNVGHGSLGRVKAMKLMFEAESQKQNDTPKRFPLRKSYSVDSRLGNGENPRNNLNRRSLGDDVKLDVSNHEISSDICSKGSNSQQANTINSPVDTKNNIDVFTSEVEIRSEHVVKTEQNYVSEVDHVTLSTDNVSSRGQTTVERNSMYHMLNHSEENFLSDIPEEKEDYGEMSGASNEKLLDFPIQRKASKSYQISQLRLFKTESTKNYWSSTLGLCRVLSDSDLDKIKLNEEIQGIKSSDKKSGRPLERSASLSSLNTKTEFGTTLKLAPTLHRSCRQPFINEISVMGRVKDIVKDHILKQLANSVESESDDDFHNYSFEQLLAKKQKQNYLMQSYESKFHSPIPQKFPGDFPCEPFSLGCHGNDLTLSSNEEKGEDRGRQSSKESSPMIDNEKPSKFRSDYYSLCMVGSNRSLFSGSNEGESEQLPVEESHSANCKEDPLKCRQCIKAKNTEEFHMISKQLQSLSKTVNALQQSLHGVEDSCDSDLESNEDRSHMFVSSNSDFHADGYQWIEDDEFYLTPCGGELIMGSSPFSDTGACAEWINEYADDTSCNDEFEFYGNFAGETVDVHNLDPPIKEEENSKSEQSRVIPPHHHSPASKVKNSPRSHDSYSKQKALKQLKAEGHVRHHSDGHLHMNQTTDKNKVLDPQVRSAMLDAMVHLSGASMDSLDDNIGVDHMMCSRLIGGDKGAVRSTSTRSAMDLSQFFVRYGQPEEEAVAAFDFLDEINPGSDPVEQTTEVITSQSNESSHSTQPELTNRGPENISLPISKEKQKELEKTETKGKSQDVKENEKVEVKNKPVKSEKKFFNFTRTKSSKSAESVKEKESKLPKKVKTKETKDKEVPKEKSKIPKFRNSEPKVAKQLNGKPVQDTVKSTNYKSVNSHLGSHEHVASYRINNRIVDKL